MEKLKTSIDKHQSLLKDIIEKINCIKDDIRHDQVQISSLVNNYSVIEDQTTHLHSKSILLSLNKQISLELEYIEQKISLDQHQLKFNEESNSKKLEILEIEMMNQCNKTIDFSSKKTHPDLELKLARLSDKLSGLRKFK